MAAHGFDGASVPLGIDDRKRERLTFIEGEVAVPLYPRWAQTDDALSSLASLMRCGTRWAAKNATTDCAAGGTCTGRPSRTHSPDRATIDDNAARHTCREGR
jgi:hypothetical protein